MTNSGEILTIEYSGSISWSSLLPVLSASLSFLVPGVRFGDDAHHALFQRLTLKEEPVLVPDEVRAFEVEAVPLHAAFEQIDDVLVVWIGNESEPAAVVHVLFELWRLVEAELIDGNFFLLTLNVIIFFIFRASGEPLPGQRAA